MDANENGEVSVMSEVDISEGLPNGDDSAFTSEVQQHEAHGTDEDSESGTVSIGQVQTNDTVTITTNPPGIAPDQVFVATSQGLLAAEQLQNVNVGIKTTHIVIHDQTLNDLTKTPQTPLPPPTPSTPNSRERGLRYQWDDAVQMNVLPVRCKSSNGELHKHKFGSGKRIPFTFIAWGDSIVCIWVGWGSKRPTSN